MKPYLILHHFSRVNALYIPHGSDETSIRSSLITLFSSFISHMVQMKPLSFLSTMLEKTTLYPTWFRWNSVKRQNSHCSIPLYIPHGSDETQISFWFFLICKGFISHMVQMKLQLDLFHYKLFCFSLYPTWFRWNKNRNCKLRLRVVLYIPHGSDETLSPRAI